MRRIYADGDKVTYEPITDILFVSFGDGDHSLMDHEEEAGNGVFLNYSWPSEDLVGMEVWGFKKNFGSLPAVVTAGDIEIHVPEQKKLALT